MTPPPPHPPHKRIDLSPEQLEAFLAQLQERLEPEQFALVKAMADTLILLSQAVDQKAVSIRRLLRTLFGASSEKTRKVLKGALRAAGKPAPPAAESAAYADQKPAKAPGHGRNGVADYPGAEHIAVPHETLAAGQRCPECNTGKLYPMAEPATTIRFTGQAPIAVTVWELERLRCNPTEPSLRPLAFFLAPCGRMKFIRIYAPLPKGHAFSAKKKLNGAPLAAFSDVELCRSDEVAPYF